MRVLEVAAIPMGAPAFGNVSPAWSVAPVGEGDLLRQFPLLTHEAPGGPEKVLDRFTTHGATDFVRLLPSPLLHAIVADGVVTAIQHAVAELGVAFRAFTAHAALESHFDGNSGTGWPVRPLMVVLAPSAVAAVIGEAAVLSGEGAAVVGGLRRGHCIG